MKSTAVNAGFRSSRQSQQKQPSKGARDDLSSLNKILDQVCQIHSTPGKPANHTHIKCWVFKQSGKLNAKHKGKDTQSEDEDEPHKQSTGEQNKFPLEVKIVNVLHVIKGRNKAALRKTEDFPTRSKNSELTSCDNTKRQCGTCDTRTPAAEWG